MTLNNSELNGEKLKLTNGGSVMENKRMRGYGFAVEPGSSIGNEELEKARKKAIETIKIADNFLVFSENDECSACASCISSHPDAMKRFMDMIGVWLKQTVHMVKNAPKPKKLEAETSGLDDTINKLKDDLKKAAPSVEGYKVDKVVETIERDVSAMAASKVIIDQIKRVGVEKVTEAVDEVLADFPETTSKCFSGLIASMSKSREMAAALAKMLGKKKGDD